MKCIDKHVGFVLHAALALATRSGRRRVTRTLVRLGRGEPLVQVLMLVDIHVIEIRKADLVF